MRLYEYSSVRFGIGSNPGGGVYITLIPETAEERQLLDEIAGHRFRRRITKDGDEVPTYTVDERDVITKYGVPIDGGPSRAWDRLAEYLGEDPIKWARKVQPV